MTCDVRSVGKRPIDADMAQIDVQAAHARLAERRQQQAQDFAIGAQLGVAVELGADLQDFARACRACDDGSQHAACITKPRAAGLVEQMRVDAGNLRRDVGPDP